MFGIQLPMRLPIARGIALFLAMFTLLNIAGAHLSPGFDANVWWIDLGFVPRLAGSMSLSVAALALLAFAVGFPDHYVTRRLVSIAIAALTAAVFGNIVSFYWHWFSGGIHPGVPFPLSFLLTLTLGFVLRCSFLPWGFKTTGQRVGMVVSFLACFVLFPLAQMYCFGKTDYRRKADAIVVFGALAYEDGRPSQPLEDRVRTAVELYHAGLAPHLIFSGGPGRGKISEPESMRTLALSLNVPDSAIWLDEAGLNTDATVKNTAITFKDQQIHKVLAVSNFYHLPRVKMTYSRALAATKPSVEVYTVPAKEPQQLRNLPYFMAREVVALWVYYLRPLAGK